jgi:hypothetical protein
MMAEQFDNIELAAERVRSDSYFRDGFLEGAAQAFFVSAYADYCEDGETSTDHLPRPGPGGSWHEFAPPPPGYAYALAGRLWDALVRLNDISCIEQLAERANKADGKHPDPIEFGWYLAMPAMGHGVHWFDDHKSFPLRLPHIECSFLSFAFDAYEERDEQ